MLIGIKTTNVDAVTITTDDQAMDAAPDGLQLGDLSSDNLFELGSHTDGSDSSIYKGDVLRLTQVSIPNQVASVWSNESRENYIDTGQKQTLSVWLYFGANIGGSEGMALVLQNDKNTTNAIAKDGNNIAGGESMGVWGSDVSNKKDKSAIAASAIQNSWALEFDGIVNSSGNNSYEDYDNGTPGNSFDDYQPDPLNRRISDQHMAWAYPGSPDSYNLLGNVSSGFLGMDKTNYYELLHNDIDQVPLNFAADASLAWHHLIIKYTPPTDADPDEATLEYKFNDKSLNGYAQHLKTGQTYVDHTLNLKLSNLGLKKGDPLLYGFTAANGSSQDNSELNSIVFESMPSIVDADENAYVVDETNKNKISSSNDVMTDDDKKLPDTTTVHPKDDLTFNYMIRYNSGKEDLADPIAKIDLPDNIKLTTDTSGNIGKIVYADGSSDPISSGTVDGNTVTVKINKTLTSSFNTAKVVLNATAADVLDDTSSLKVEASHAKFESNNYIADVQTPEFSIMAPQDNLTITKTSTDPVTISPKGSTNLTGTMKFDNQANVDNSDMDIYVSVDGGESKIYKDTASDNGKFSIPFGSSDVKQHKITVQVVDDNYTSASGIKDVIASNKLTYTVNVQDLALIASSDSLSTTILNQTSVPMPAITAEYNDGSDISGSDLSINYTISNPNYDSGNPESGQATVKGIAESESSETQLSYDMLIDNSDDPGLKVGKNTIKVTVADGAGHTSNALTYVIDVQDKNPVLSYGDGTDGNITQMGTDDTIDFPIKSAYEDNLSFAPSDLTYSVSVDGKKVADLPKSSDDASTTSYDSTIELTQAALGIDDQTTPTHTVTFKATDPYGRVSNKLTYNLKMIYKSASLTYKDDYSFGALNQSPEERIVKRTSDWDIAVNTIDSPYQLTASAGDLTSDNQTLAGQLIYVNPNSSQVTSMNSPVLVSENDNDTTNSYSISSKWGSDAGVLLEVDPNAVAGSYSGKIKWNLTDSLD